MKWKHVKYRLLCFWGGSVLYIKKPAGSEVSVKFSTDIILWKYCLRECDVLQSDRSLPTLRWNIWPPPSRSKTKPRNQKAELFVFCMLVNYLAYSSAVKIERVCSSQTSARFCQTTPRHIPEESHFRENLKFNGQYSSLLRILCCCWN